MNSHLGFKIVRFNQDSLSQNPLQKNDLLDFYCHLWMYDPNFAEYRRCPICRKFYSQQEVEVQGIRSCSGIKTPHPLSNLEIGWTPEIVQKDLDPQLLMGKDFFGALAVIQSSNQVVGFVWGYAIDFSQLSKKWAPSLIEKINQLIPCQKVAYFQEIGSDPNLRGYGIGSALCKSLVSWMKTNYPDIPSMLHTHESSPAYRLFYKSGYRIFGRTDQINPGRIFMASSLSSLLTPENL